METRFGAGVAHCGLWHCGFPWKYCGLPGVHRGLLSESLAGAHWGVGGGALRVVRKILGAGSPPLMEPLFLGSRRLPAGRVKEDRTECSVLHNASNLGQKLVSSITYRFVNSEFQRFIRNESVTLRPFGAGLRGSVGRHDPNCARLTISRGMRTERLQRASRRAPNIGRRAA